MELILSEYDIKKAIIYYVHKRGISENAEISDVTFTVIYPEDEEASDDPEAEVTTSQYILASVGGDMTIIEKSDK